jgi:hypothetical protein
MKLTRAAHLEAVIRTLSDTRERMFAIMFRKNIVADVMQGFVTLALLINNSQKAINFLYEYEIHLHVEF